MYTIPCAGCVRYGDIAAHSRLRRKEQAWAGAGKGTQGLRRASRRKTGIALLAWYISFSFHPNSLWKYTRHCGPVLKYARSTARHMRDRASVILAHKVKYCLNAHTVNGVTELVHPGELKDQSPNYYPVFSLRDLCVICHCISM